MSRPGALRLPSCKASSCSCCCSLDARRSALKAAAAAPAPAHKTSRLAARSAAPRAGKHLLSFAAGDEDADGGPGTLGSRILPAHAFAGKGGDGGSLAVEMAADDVAALEASALAKRSRTLVTEGASGEGSLRSSAAAAAAPCVVGSGGGGEGEEEDDAAAFDAAQRAAMRQKRARLAGGVSAGTGAPRAAHVNAGGTDDVAAEEAAATEGRDASTTDYLRLRDELRASRRAAAVVSSPDAPGSSMMTPLQEMRAKYKARAKTLGGRESDTLAKLQAFKATLRGAAAAAATAVGPSDKLPGSSSAEVYSGQVLEDAGDDGGAGGDDAWMAHRLKFKKHIDDKFRAGGLRDDGFETIDPLREKGGSVAGGGRSGRG